MKIAVALSLLIIAFASISFASLGGHRDGIDSEKDKLKAVKAVEVFPGSNYTVVRITTPYSVVNQYTDSNGAIFAVTWRGNSPPDLSVVLGKHFQDYKTARETSAPRRGRRPLLIKTGKIVVRHFGHMRDIRGLAYQPELIPQGVQAEDLQ